MLRPPPNFRETREGNLRVSAKPTLKFDLHNIHSLTSPGGWTFANFGVFAKKDCSILPPF